MATLSDQFGPPLRSIDLGDRRDGHREEIEMTRESRIGGPKKMLHQLISTLPISRQEPDNGIC